MLRNDVTFLSNNNYVLISSLNSQIQVFDIKNEQEVIKYNGHSNVQHLLDMKIFDAPNGESYLISGSENNRLYMWNAEDGTDYKSFMINNDNSTYKAVNCLSLSAGNNLLATSSFTNDYNYSTIDISASTS